MRTPSTTGVLVAAAFLGLTGSAAGAQAITRIDRVERPTGADQLDEAESASVYFRSDAPQGMHEARMVRDGETAWIEAIFPTQAVRLTGNAPLRRRSGCADGIAAGSLLFGVHLTSSVAFCEPIAYEDGIERVQCYRDLDGDGTFDGAYLSREQNLDSPLLVAGVHAPMDVSQIPYETVYPQDQLSTTSRIVLEVRNGRPTFRRYIDEERLDARYPCRPVDADPDLCTVLGVTLRIEAEGEAYRVTPVDVRPNREFAVQLSSSTL